MGPFCVLCPVTGVCESEAKGLTWSLAVSLCESWQLAFHWFRFISSVGMTTLQVQQSFTQSSHRRQRDRDTSYGAGKEWQ